jgi:Ricin-type beta-trefoil lectin domain
MEGTAMRKIFLLMTALGLLLLVSPAYADDPCKDTAKKTVWTVVKDIAGVAKNVAGIYTAVNAGNYSGVSFSDLSDVKDKFEEWLGWKSNDSDPVTLDEVQCEIDTHLDTMWSALHFDVQQTVLIDAQKNAEDSFDDATANRLHTFVKDDEDQSKDAVTDLTYSGPSNIAFTRGPHNAQDTALWDLLNSDCERTDKSKKGGKSGCVYNLDDLYVSTANGGSVVYDWRLGLPRLLMYIGQRLQVMAAMHPEFFVDPDRILTGSDGRPDKTLPTWKNELLGYRDTLNQHYQKIVSGIKCGFYDKNTCADIYSGYKASSGLGVYAVYRDLPLYELKAMVDTLYLYTRSVSDPARTDLTQNYHHLPTYWPVYGIQQECLEAKKVEFGYSVSINPCNGKSSQRWVYDRAKGTLTNSGSVIEPASGQCLGVLGGSLPLQVVASQCTDPKSPNHKPQQWTYDPETHLLRNGTGTVLKFVAGNGSVSVTTSGYTPEFQWGAEGLITIPLPYNASFTIPPFSDAMKPGEVMHKGDSRVSHNNGYELILQTDGNLVLYDKTPKPTNPTIEVPTKIWASNTNGRAVDRVVMQPDGNLAIYPPSGDCALLPTCNSRPTAAIWQSGTRGHASSKLRVQDDGKLIIYDASSNAIWP